MAELNGEIIERKRGDTAPDIITVVDPADGVTPINNTGFQYRMTINTEKDPVPGVGTELTQITGAPGGASGSVSFNWLPADADQEPGVYWYDIEQVDGAGKVKTIAKNQYIFYQDITKVN
jgi:hypothetical protein